MAEISRLNESEACQEEIIKIKTEEKNYLQEVVNKLTEKSKAIVSKIKEKEKLVKNIKINDNTEDKEIDELFSIIDEEIIELKLKTKQNEDIAINISNLQQELTSACKKLCSKDGFYNQLIKHEKEECSKHLNIIQETISYLRNDETTNEIKNKNEEIYKCLLDYFEKHYEKDEKFINKLKSKCGCEECEKQNRRIEEKEGESERKDNGEGEENYECEGDEKINCEESKEQENYKISRVYVHEIKLKLKHLANLITIFDENRESFKSYKEDISDKLKSLYNSLECCFQNNTDIVMQIKEYK